ncbi:carbon-nitrogen hydrolase family protein [Cyclobacterium roseum]|uniref:carbon-nitrogen hydrolase family protein n=1 Tax=Cyclobacterium roseum TaxID=2666137 RepID=UPI001391E0A7|nr:carbon-nitrogen hydrolase family protein [Cyclobacterium roseum]
MKIALIQLKAEKGNVSHNIANHISWIERVVMHNPDLIIFPELSITGFEPTLAKELAFQESDKRFDVFQKYSDKMNCSISFGLPLKKTQGIQIAMLIFQPKIPRTFYSKQWLHEDEIQYFTPGTSQTILSVNDTCIAPAICYESLNPSHLTNCLTLGTAIYLASVSKHDKGISEAYKYYSKIASLNSMPVLVVNSVGYCDNFMSAGQSAVWDSKGNLVENLSTDKEGFLLYDYMS